jgi:hypothetical protein
MFELQISWLLISAKMCSQWVPGGGGGGGGFIFNIPLLPATPYIKTVCCKETVSQNYYLFIAVEFCKASSNYSHNWLVY